MIRATQVRKTFGDTEVIHHIDFEIPSHAVTGLLGPNGAGKTTTMRMMAGYITPDSGDILIDGTSIVRHPTTVQANIGYMPETNPLYPSMLVSEILSFAADIKHMDKKSRKNAYDFVVPALSLEKVYHTPIGELSKGYRQRVGLALALLNRPSVLLLDEPTEGLDPNQRTEIRALIKELAKERTIVVSTHVLQEAQAMCERLVIISEGHIVANNTIDALTHEARNSVTYECECEGDGIEQELKRLGKDIEVEILSKDGRRVRANIHGNDASYIPPHLSKCAARNKWTIWKLAQKEKKLEDVFTALTK